MNSNPTMGICIKPVKSAGMCIHWATEMAWLAASFAHILLVILHKLGECQNAHLFRLTNDLSLEPWLTWIEQTSQQLIGCWRKLLLCCAENGLTECRLSKHIRYFQFLKNGFAHNFYRELHDECKRSTTQHSHSIQMRIHHHAVSKLYSELKTFAHP